jgi:beta-mannosidase
MLIFREMSLNGVWDLRDETISSGLESARKLTAETSGWIDQPVPGDIHQGLIAAGRIKEPLVGLNSFDCRWTESRSWWFRKTFECSPDWLEAEIIELEMNGLDSNAEIFVNGDLVGEHYSAFYPFVKDVRPWLKAGKNYLVVKLTAGVENVSEKDVQEANGQLAAGPANPERNEPRRVYARKPQYTFGWDWSPRLATTAIGGNVILRVLSGSCIRHVALQPRREGSSVIVKATIEVDHFHYYKTSFSRAEVRLLSEDGQAVMASQEALLRSGMNYIDLELLIPEPRLWWPNGLGDQHLYRVEAALETEGGSMRFPPFDFGIRFLELETQGRFVLRINGERIFCKGGDWIPADALYARISGERYETLVREARAANFNMLRVWGGGLYEPEAFYHACDKNGILLWHDFMYACAPYPDHLKSFQIEAEHEARYQVRRLQKHACLALWCGNNENTWGFRDWWHDQVRGGAWIYNYLLPRIVHENVPEIPYWNSSPYGGDAPNTPEVGDYHLWHEIMMNPEMQKRITPEEYDRNPAAFITEFGYVGACSQETMREALCGAPFDIESQVWLHHTNTFEKNTVLAGIRKHYLNPEGLGMDDYFLYSGLCQGLMLGYALESMRANPICYGGLFWMYEDCWGEIGWTAIDYGLRRKTSWWYIRRAFEPLRLILRPSGDDQIRVILANDTRSGFSGELETGYICLDGSSPDMHRRAISVPALSRTELATFSREAHDPATGLWFARFPVQSGISTAIFRAVDYRALRVTKASLSLQEEGGEDGVYMVKVSSSVYAHAVHFILPEGSLPSDNYFDLLPGESRAVRIKSQRKLEAGAVGVRCVNG